jgi:hypothetical protein
METGSAKIGTLPKTVLSILHGSHWIFYAMMLSYATPPMPASAYVTSGILLLWLYACILIYNYELCYVFAAIVTMVDIAVTAESLDVYQETQRLLVAGRGNVHLLLATYFHVIVNYRYL